MFDRSVTQLVFILIAFVAAACRSSGDVITLEGLGCEGMCPVYTVTVQTATGKVRFTEGRPVRMDSTYYVPESESRQLAVEFRNSRFFSMHDDLIDLTQDLYTHALSDSTDKQYHRVIFNGTIKNRNSDLDYLEALEVKVLELTHVDAILKSQPHW
jgi:hypothetical protein